MSLLGTIPSNTDISAFWVETVRSVSGDATLAATDSILLVDATLAVVTVTLPTAVGIQGKRYTVKKVGAGVLGVTIDANGSETIDGGLTTVVSTLNTALTLVSDGANWRLI